VSMPQSVESVPTSSSVPGTSPSPPTPTTTTGVTASDVENLAAALWSRAKLTPEGHAISGHIGALLAELHEEIGRVPTSVVKEAETVLTPVTTTLLPIAERDTTNFLTRLAAKGGLPIHIVTFTLSVVVSVLAATHTPIPTQLWDGFFGSLVGSGVAVQTGTN
jgi:hypothetical protein